MIKIIEKEDEGIMAAGNIVKEMSKADDNWFIQNSRWVAKRDQEASKAIARRKGREEGLAEGLAEGRAEGALNKAIEAAVFNIRKYKASPEEAAKDMGAPLDKVLEALEKSK